MVSSMRGLAITTLVSLLGVEASRADALPGWDEVLLGDASLPDMFADRQLHPTRTSLVAIAPLGESRFVLASVEYDASEQVCLYRRDIDVAAGTVSEPSLLGCDARWVSANSGTPASTPTRVVCANGRLAPRYTNFLTFQLGSTAYLLRVSHCSTFATDGVPVVIGSGQRPSVNWRTDAVGRPASNWGGRVAWIDGNQVHTRSFNFLMSLGDVTVVDADERGDVDRGSTSVASDGETGNYVISYLMRSHAAQYCWLANQVVSASGVLLGDRRMIYGDCDWELGGHFERAASYRFSGGAFYYAWGGQMPYKDAHLFGVDGQPLAVDGPQVNIVDAITPVAVGRHPFAPYFALVRDVSTQHSLGLFVYSGWAGAWQELESLDILCTPAPCSGAQPLAVAALAGGVVIAYAKERNTARGRQLAISVRDF